ncbi:DUF1016 N-terminal domain-containing protein [Paramicrobacterium fandaimingii]|uniref:DUF1016 N-terminal domain-containing protein n=1 Tax=Paramicrobacterium fandaimingii TaxID=2708079 RepID=UPI001FD214B6|nr:DUF1016 N-terminal domain-containing protein [Microbacterium fandaimingii]
MGRTVSSCAVQLQWRIGRTILERQKHESWGSSIVERRAQDLRAEFPSMKGFSRANLFYMRRFAHAWSDQKAIVQ